MNLNEIQTPWLVQLIVRDRITIHQQFSTSDVAKVIRELGLSVGTNKAHDYLDKMNCTPKTHLGSKGGGKLTRNPNQYERVSDAGIICASCLVQSCLIRHPEMAAQFGLDKPIGKE